MGCTGHRQLCNYSLYIHIHTCTVIISVYFLVIFFLLKDSKHLIRQSMSRCLVYLFLPSRLLGTWFGQAIGHGPTYATSDRSIGLVCVLHKVFKRMPIAKLAFKAIMIRNVIVLGYVFVFFRAHTLWLKFTIDGGFLGQLHPGCHCASRHLCTTSRSHGWRDSIVSDTAVQSVHSVHINDSGRSDPSRRKSSARSKRPQSRST